jgi:hypothetical protein
MKSIFKYLRLKQSKPIPKKGSPEYIELQKRLIERKSKVQEPEPEIVNQKTPKALKYLMISSTFPSTLGLVCLMTSDYSSSLYNTSLALTGAWVGTTSVMLNGYLIGLEAFMYSNPSYTDPKNFIFIGTRRVFLSLLGLPMGFLCIQSTVSSTSGGMFGYFIWLLLTTLITIRSTEKKLIPSWLGNSHWLWLIHTQLITIFLAYSLFNKESKLISN